MYVPLLKHKVYLPVYLDLKKYLLNGKSIFLV